MTHRSDLDDAFAVYEENLGGDDGNFEEAFQGFFESFREFAEMLVEETGDIPRGSLCEQYFDYDAFARDLEHDYWHERVPGKGVAVFRNL